MVRLSCKEKNCNKVWLETKRQRESERVYCPKCAALHHHHTSPIIPPQPTKYKDIEKPKREKAPYENPPEVISLKRIHLDGTTAGFDRGFRTDPDYKPKKKVKKE